MRALGTFFSALALFTFSVFSGCSTAPKSPEVANSIRGAFDHAGLKDVSVSQDREKGVVTLGGQVRYDADKVEAESLAKPLAGSQVVADQIAVVPPEGAGAAKKVNADLDEGISKNLDAALIQNHLYKDVKGSVKSGVVTLTGEVRSQERRAEVQRIAASIPNVQQVVNELQVTDQKATSSELH